MWTPLDNIEDLLTVMTTEVAKGPAADLDLVFDSSSKALSIVARTSWHGHGYYTVKIKKHFLSRRAALVKQAETLSRQAKKHKTYIKEQLSLAI